jgi:hypothetical protein
LSIICLNPWQESIYADDVVLFCSPVKHELAAVNVTSQNFPNFGMLNKIKYVDCIDDFVGSFEEIETFEDLFQLFSNAMKTLYMSG